jgi:ankyrin repeat protein
MSQRHTPITGPITSVGRKPRSQSAANFKDDSDLEDDGKPYQTTLHIAAEAGHESIVDMLLNSGSFIDELDSEENTPLHRATMNEKLGVVRKLLKYGADPNVTNAAGRTPVHIAASTGSLEIIGALVRHGGDLSKRARGG